MARTRRLGDVEPELRRVCRSEVEMLGWRRRPRRDVTRENSWCKVWRRGYLVLENTEAMSEWMRARSVSPQTASWRSRTEAHLRVGAVEVGDDGSTLGSTEK
ncbi:hypothetical protein GUJ93_ZPchr0013g36157 [Zizania palustris]|uniref:Uncharacterized protein n=1 Tax=Zizania palustris TaxID=103762 RepID=A0A8J6BZ08_ZIZPA|nr:hypothetical protein GUJ93_ZPchr0013g36157 [Zizania palustris]